MKDPIRSAADKFLRYSPAQPLMSHRAVSRLTVLAYHGIEDRQSFASQLDYLGRSASFVSLAQVLDHIVLSVELPPRPVLATFDDGDPSVLAVAAPELHRRNIPAVAFVVPHYVGGSQPFWWEKVAWLHSRADSTRPLAELIRFLKQLPNDARVAYIAAMESRASHALPARAQLSFDDLSQLEEMGIEVGNHSQTHPILTQCTHRELAEEVGASDRVLAEHLGHPVRAFAYPNGDHNAAVVETVRSSGYQAAFCFDHSLEPLPIRHPLQISRVRVGSTTGIDRLSIIVSGLHPWVHRMSGRR